MPIPEGQESANTNINESGPLSIEGLIVRTSSSVTVEQGRQTSVLGGNIYVDVIARDPYSGELVTVENVRVATTPGTLMCGLSNGQRVSLRVPSYSAFRAKNAAVMEAVPNAQNPTIQNMAIPTPVRHRDTTDCFNNSPSRVCRQFNEMQEQARRHMGILFNRDDITVLQGRGNGRSPGVVVHQANGQVIMFDNSGQQYIMMNGQNVQVVASEVDIGQARIGRNAAGFPVPMEENKLNDYVPQGTIITPQPKLIPHITKTLATINLFLDLVDFVRVCKQAADILTGRSTASVEDVTREAQTSSMQSALMGQSSTHTGHTPTQGLPRPVKKKKKKKANKKKTQSRLKRAVKMVKDKVGGVGKKLKKMIKKR